MHADDIRLLFAYTYGATGQILAAASRLAPGELTAAPPLRGSKSLRDILVHMLDVEQAWREELIAGREDVAPLLDPAAFPDVATLARAWRDDEGRMLAWLDTLDDAALQATTFTGRPLWVMLAHVVNHATQHRSEAAMILTHWGQSPGDLDLTFYLRGWRDA